jgi:hypothetical protein
MVRKKNVEIKIDVQATTSACSPLEYICFAYQYETCFIKNNKFFQWLKQLYYSNSHITRDYKHGKFILPPCFTVNCVAK